MTKSPENGVRRRLAIRKFLQLYTARLIDGDLFMNEIWVPISDYEELYEVSNLGHVRKLRFINNYVNKPKIFLIKPSKNKYGYLGVSLYKNGSSKHFLVHRLVAFAFIPMVEGKYFVNHKDGNKENNCVDNLEWCTRSENMRHAFDNGLARSGAKGKFGSESGKAIAVDMFSKDGELLKSFGSLIEAANFVGASKSSHICSCCKGKLKTAYGYVWKYSEAA